MKSQRSSAFAGLGGAKSVGLGLSQKMSQWVLTALCALLEDCS